MGETSNFYEKCSSLSKKGDEKSLRTLLQMGISGNKTARVALRKTRNKKLSSLFNVSLDQLIKGDIEKMKEIISEQEIKKFNYYGSIYTVHLAVLIISAVPLFMWLGRYAYTIMRI